MNWEGQEWKQIEQLDYKNLGESWHRLWTIVVTVMVRKIRGFKICFGRMQYQWIQRADCIFSGKICV